MSVICSPSFKARLCRLEVAIIILMTLFMLMKIEFNGFVGNYGFTCVPHCRKVNDEFDCYCTKVAYLRGGDENIYVIEYKKRYHEEKEKKDNKVEEIENAAIEECVLEFKSLMTESQYQNFEKQIIQYCYTTILN